MAKKLSPATIPTAHMDFKVGGVRVPGLRSLTSSGGERNVSNIRDFDGVQVITTSGDIPSYSADFNPSFALDVWSEMYDSWIDGKLKSIKIVTKAVELFSALSTQGATIAISSSGECTFADSSGPNGDHGEAFVGAVIKAKSKYHPIIEVDGKTIKVEKPASDVSATSNYKVLVPSMTWSFNAVITGPIVPSFSEDSTSITIGIQPITHVALPVIGG